MIRPICTDLEFLSQKCIEAGPEDKIIAMDMLETYNADRDRIIALSSNMIGYNKRIILIDNGYQNLIMLNPRYVKRTNMYATVETSICHPYKKLVRRFDYVEVEYQNLDMSKERKSFKTFRAQLVQQMMENLDGMKVN